MTRRRLLRWILGLFSIGLAIAAAIFLNPSPPPLRAPLAGEPAPLDARSGLYRDSAQGLWLVAPALDTGWLRYRVDRHDAAVRVAPASLAGEAFMPLTDPPYRLHVLQARSEDAALEGWLFEPTGPAKGGIVLLHGSGNSDRHNGWYVYLAHVLAAQGHVVVLPDKRGSGRSQGDWRNASFDLLAQDGVAWLNRLRAARPGLVRYGFVGVSQGGMLAPEAATLAGADFVAVLSAAAVPLREQLELEVGNGVRDGGAPRLVQPAMTWLFAWRAERRQPEFWAANGDYDMIGHLRSYPGPVLIVYGREDEYDNVPVAASLRRLESLRDQPNIEWRAYDGVGHALATPEGRFLPDFLDDLARWLDRHAEGAAAPEAG